MQSPPVVFEDTPRESGALIVGGGGGGSSSSSSNTVHLQQQLRQSESELQQNRDNIQVAQRIQTGLLIVQQHTTAEHAPVVGHIPSVASVAGYSESSKHEQQQLPDYGCRPEETFQEYEKRLASGQRRHQRS